MSNLMSMTKKKKQPIDNIIIKNRIESYDKLCVKDFKYLPAYK